MDTVGSQPAAIHHQRLPICSEMSDQAHDWSYTGKGARRSIGSAAVPYTWRMSEDATWVRDAIAKLQISQTGLAKTLQVDERLVR